MDSIWYLHSIIALPGYPDYDEGIHRRLHELHLTVPFKYEGDLFLNFWPLFRNNFWTRLLVFDIVSSYDAIMQIIKPPTPIFLSIIICVGHYNDELRNYTHLRLKSPGFCDCYSCQAKIYELEKQEEVWERTFNHYASSSRHNLRIDYDRTIHKFIRYISDTSYLHALIWHLDLQSSITLQFCQSLSLRIILL